MNEGIDASGSMIPRTPRAEIDNNASIGIHSNITNDNEMQIPINLISRELATETPPPQDIPLDPTKSSESDGEGDEYLKQCSHGMSSQSMSTTLRSQVGNFLACLI